MVTRDLKFPTLMLFSLAACVVSKNSLEGGSDTSSGGSSSTAAQEEGSSGGVSSTAGVSSTSAGTTTEEGTSDGTSEVGSTTSEDEEEETGSKLDVDVTPSACDGLDHATCWANAETACAGQGNWSVDQECVDAVTACYALGTELIDPAVVIDFCHAEQSKDCDAGGDDLACGDTFCRCAVGEYPFDFDSCWHLTTLSCPPWVDGNCEEVLAQCYPGTTVEEYSSCREEVLDAVGDECDCPMCGLHEACEAALTECLAG